MGDWEKNGEGAKKQNFLERKGPINVVKHCCFLLITVKNMTAIKMPREVKTSNLTKYTGLQQVAETSAGFTGPSKLSIPRILPNAAEHSKSTI